MIKFGKAVVKFRIPILILSFLLLIPAGISYINTRINYDILSYLPGDIDTMKGQDILLEDFGTGAFSLCVVEDMSEKQVVDLENEIKGVYLETDAQRYYPYSSLAAQVMGFVSTDNVGSEGLEAYYDSYLQGTAGKVVTTKGNYGSEMLYTYEKYYDASDGDSLVTTIDQTVQHYLEKNLETAIEKYDIINGAFGIVMDVNSGQILAMANLGSYDPNNYQEIYDQALAGQLEAQYQDALLLDKDSDAYQEAMSAYNQAVAAERLRQWRNRCVSDGYEPGSTFKMLTVLEYMKENPNTWQDYVYNCNGSYQNGDYTIKCYHGTAHGAQNLIQAFANSCNGAFAEIGMQINSEKFRALANQMLFNSELPYTLPYNQSTFSLDGSSDDWEKLQTAIGQGKTQITPLHNLMIVSAIANGGTLMKPYMIDHVENVGGQTVKKFLPSAYGTLMSANDAQFLTHLMSQVVEIGTGSAMRGASYTVAGKTGSAEFEAGKETHSWFVGFAPADKPKVAICVLAEESGSGGAVAAPIARQVLDRYFTKYGQ